ncbi:hypothetical protein MMC08_001746 [Hypocenomyce scalaris]|nr:hypothetical protein [Hypocenomyce scalaris]
MPLLLLRYGANRSPLGHKARPTRISTSWGSLSLRCKAPKTLGLALSTAPASPARLHDERAFKHFANKFRLRERLDHPEKDLSRFEEDDAQVQGELERLREDDGLFGGSPLQSAAENGGSDPDSIGEAKQDVLDALRNGDPEKLLHAFQRASVDQTYVGSIPATTFMEILRILDPKVFIDPYKKVHRDLHPGHVQQLGAEQFKDIFLRFMNSIRDMIRKRRAAGYKLGIGEYRFILNCIRSGGNSQAAKAVWNDMLDAGIEPDTPCYNHYFEALCWTNAYDPVEREKMRFIPYHMSMRLPVKRGQRRRKGFQGYSTGDTGLRQEMVQLFSNMVQTGIMADEKTFCLLMTAMAREGDLVGPKSILKKVWDVDVEALLSDDGNATRSVEILPPTSPVYPSKELLFTVAHIFGSNNEIPIALRVVDHISHKYSLSIGREVWAELLEWTFVLASRRYGARKSDGAQLGQLPRQSVESLWNTMVSEPYNIMPTMPMYNRLIRNLSSREMLDAMLSKMREGRRRWMLQRARSNRRILRLHQAEADRSHAAKFGTSIEAMRKEVRLQMLYEARDFAMVRRWVRLLFAGRRWVWGADRKGLGWELRGLPSAMKEWQRFKPRKGFAYSAHAGRFEFDPSSDLSVLVRRTDSALPGILVVQSLK